MSRQTVLALLRQREGEYLSGEELSRQLGLSRTAVWKAVDTLLCSSPTSEGDLRQQVTSAAWQYHVGGDAHEA